MIVFIPAVKPLAGNTDWEQSRDLVYALNSKISEMECPVHPDLSEDSSNDNIVDVKVENGSRQVIPVKMCCSAFEQELMARVRLFLTDYTPSRHLPS